MELATTEGVFLTLAEYNTLVVSAGGFERALAFIKTEAELHRTRAEGRHGDWFAAYSSLVRQMEERGDLRPNADVTGLAPAQESDK